MHVHKVSIFIDHYGTLKLLEQLEFRVEWIKNVKTLVLASYHSHDVRYKVSRCEHESPALTDSSDSEASHGIKTNACHDVRCCFGFFGP